LPVACSFGYDLSLMLEVALLMYPQRRASQDAGSSLQDAVISLLC
jgi:hypothetical protein